MNKIGLRQRIAQAKSVDELNALIQEAAVYDFSSQRTRRAWRSTYAKVLSSINNKELVDKTKKSGK